MEKEIDVRLVEIIFLDPVDGQLLFLVAQLLPLALRLGDVLLGELCDAVEFVPEQLELFVDSFLFLFPGYRAVPPICHIRRHEYAGRNCWGER